MKILRSPLFISFAFVLLAVGLGVVPATSQKLTPADVVAKHAVSIGSAEARARAKGTRIKGTVEVIVKEGGAGTSAGNVVMASHGSMNMVNMMFNAGESQSFRFDGSKTTVTQFRPGRHTPLEHFFAENEVIVGEGLVGGVLSESWPLLNLQEKNPKLEYSGTKKIDNRQVHAMKYRPRKGSELNITLFFDAETFQHVRTEYEKTVYSTAQQRIASGGGGGLPAATEARGAPQRLKVYEAFSDFKMEGGLNLPHVYKFELSVQSNVRPVLLNWTINLTEFTFTSPVDPSEFVVGNEAPKPD